MNFVKKWLSCILGFVSGVLGLALSACSGMVVYQKIDATALGRGSNEVESVTKAFKVITDGDLYKQAKQMDITTEFVWLKIFAIVTLVIAVLLIVFAVVKLLQNLNVIKCSSSIIDNVGHGLFIALLVSTIGLLICSNMYASAVEDVITSKIKLGFGSYISAITYKVSAKVGAYQPIMLVISIIAVLANGAMAIVNRKAK